MNLYLKTALVTSILLCSTNTYAEEQLSQQLAEIVDAKPIDKIPPEYPLRALQDGREGWVLLSYIVDKNGNVNEVITEGSSGLRSFERNARNAVKKWKFQPAKENGKPVEQCKNRVKLTYQIKDGHEGSVSVRFKKKYQRAQALLKAKKIDELPEVIEDIKSLKMYRIAEDFYLALLTADYYAAIGEIEKQRDILVNANIDDAYYYPEKNRFGLLQLLFSLQLKTNQLSEALDTYQKLEKFELFAKYQPSYSKVKTKIETFINGDKQVVSHGKIDDGYPWSIKLIRNQFTVTDLKGKLDSLDIRCANKRHLFTFEANNTWKLPTSWQRCSVYIKGENSTEFNFVQLPNQQTIENVAVLN